MSPPDRRVFAAHPPAGLSGGDVLESAHPGFDSADGHGDQADDGHAGEDGEDGAGAAVSVEEESEDEWGQDAGDAAQAAGGGAGEAAHPGRVQLTGVQVEG